MVTGQQIVDLAMTQTGKKYVFAVENDSRTVETSTAWDCSELVQIVCRDLGVQPVVPDGAFWQWRHCKQRGTLIPIERARTTPGALLFIGPGDEAGRTGRDAIWHVAISRGDDTTIEAKSTKDGTGTWPIGNRFSFAARIPGVTYTTPATPPPYVPPTPTPTPTPAPIMEDDDMPRYLVSDGTQVWCTDGVDIAAVTDPGDGLAAIAEKAKQYVALGWARNAVKPDGVPDIQINADMIARIRRGQPAPPATPVTVDPAAIAQALHGMFPATGTITFGGA